MPIPTALTADATTVYDACAKAAAQIHGQDYHQLSVDPWNVR